MLIYGVGVDEIDALAVRVGVQAKIRDNARARNAGGIYVILRPSGELYAQEETAHACVHGYGAFITALFTDWPDAIVKTAVTEYRGRHDFARKQGAAFAQAISLYTPDCQCRT